MPPNSILHKPEWIRRSEEMQKRMDFKNIAREATRAKRRKTSVVRSDGKRMRGSELRKG